MLKKMFANLFEKLDIQNNHCDVYELAK